VFQFIRQEKAAIASGSMTSSRDMGDAAKR
jgi:hypothetical protein